MPLGSVPPAARSRSSAEPVASVLFVCTGNVCRSPYAQLLLHRFVPDLAVASAGTHALVGSPMDEQMAVELSRQGADATGFRSRQVRPEDLAADLVLTMTRSQRAWLLEEHPRLAARIGVLGAIGSLRAARPGAPLTRGDVAAWTSGAPSGAEDIPDPFRQGAAAARRTADRLDAAVDRLADLLAPEQAVAP